MGTWLAFFTTEVLSTPSIGFKTQSWLWVETRWINKINKYSKAGQPCWVSQLSSGRIHFSLSCDTSNKKYGHPQKRLSVLASLQLGDAAVPAVQSELRWDYILKPAYCDSSGRNKDLRVLPAHRLWQLWGEISTHSLIQVLWFMGGECRAERLPGVRVVGFILFVVPNLEDRRLQFVCRFVCFLSQF